MNGQQQRPLAVVTGASSGIGIGSGGDFARKTDLRITSPIGEGFKNKAQVAAGKVLPDSLTGEMHRKQAQPATAGERNN